MIKEKLITNYPDLVTIEGTNKILNQMKNCIAKIYNGKNGTGFFSYIPYENDKLPVFITNFHVINKEFIIQNHVIKLGINDDSYHIDINLDINNRKIYLDKKYDLTIIEIKGIDKVGYNNFLELDNNLLKENSNEIYKTDNSIYIIQYPKLNKASVSYGIIKEFDGFLINHVCSTEPGSSGSPILNLKTNKVIGIHNCSFKHYNYNGGIFLKEPIDRIKINKEMKTVNQIKNFINKDKDILDMISNEEYEQNIKFFDNKEKKKSSLFEKRIFNVFGNGNNNNFLKMIQNPVNFYGNEKKIYEKSINDGIYNIIPMHCNNRAIEIYYGSTKNLANLHLYEYNNTKAQQFEVKYNSENNYYTIKCLCSNKLLTVDYNNKNNIIQKDEKKTFEQQWFIVKKGNNYEIISYIGLLMDVNGKGENLGTNISCSLRTGDLNQQFQFKSPYFPKTTYQGISIVDGLKAINAQSSFDYRKKIAIINDIKDYEGIDFQNLKLLDLLKKGVLIKPIEN